MLAQLRRAGVFAVIVAVCGPVRAQELAPPGSGVSIHKVTVTSPHSRTVKYYVTGGSARLQALVRRVEWAENELSIVEQLQLLRLDAVANERRVAAFRTEQLTDPYFPTGFVPPSFPVHGGYRESPFQHTLKEQLVPQATPGAALKLIGFLEQVQTQLDAELKALPLPEQNATQDSVDALRKRVASLPRGDAPPPPQKSVVPVIPPGRPRVGPAAPAAAGGRAPVEVRWGNSWFTAEVLQVRGDLTLIRYTNWGSSSDEWVPAGRIRPAGAVSGRPHL